MRLSLTGEVKLGHVGGKASVNTWNLNAATGDGGDFYVVYDARLGNRQNELQILTDQGGQVRRQQRWTPDDGFASVYPDLALGAAGHAALTWFDARDGNDEVLSFSRAAGAHRRPAGHAPHHLHPGPFLGASPGLERTAPGTGLERRSAR